MRARSACAAAALGVVGSLAPLAAQTTFHSHAVEITIGGRLHTQFNTTSVAGEPGSEFFIRRARVDVLVKINDFVSGFIQPEYAGSQAYLRYAYMRLDFGPLLHAAIGEIKRPFDLFTLTSSTDILVIERTGDIRGVNTCPGVGGACSYARFMERLQLAAPDIGVALDGGDRAGRLGYNVAVTNGTGTNLADQNGTKSFTGRMVLAPSANVHVGADVALHDYVNTTGANAYAPAAGADLEIGNFRQGLHVQAGVVAGANWLNPVAGSPTTFVTGQTIVTYKFPVHSAPYAEAIEPLARVSWGNPDTAVPQDGGLLVTPGLVWYISGKNKLAANVDLWHPQQGAAQWGLKLQSYLYF